MKLILKINSICIINWIYIRKLFRILANISEYILKYFKLFLNLGLSWPVSKYFLKTKIKQVNSMALKMKPLLNVSF